MLYPNHLIGCFAIVIIISAIMMISLFTFRLCGPFLPHSLHMLEGHA